MFDRMKNIVKALLDKGASKLETPELLAEEAQSQMETHIKDLKEAWTAAVTNQKMIEQSIKKNEDELASWDKRAVAAVERNEDELAKESLKKKQEIKTNLALFAQQLEEQKKAAEALKERYTEMQEKLQKFLRDKPTMTARAQASDAVAKANDLLAGTSGSSMDKWEQKIKEKEFKTAANSEADGKAIEDKFKKLDENSALDDELAALKSKVMPKLIVDTTPDTDVKKKEIVDDNVPMVVDVEEIKDDKSDKDKK
ncbi:MAG TPA: PspA/IM30 family protein [Trichormus sp.]|jgi:phage shock protein A